MKEGLPFSRLSDRLAGKSSSVWDVHNRACQLLEQGEDIILLSLGDPDMVTLDSTIEHAVSSLKNGRTHYPPVAGEPGLRKVIADIEYRTSGKPCSPDEVIIFPGATNAIFSVMSCLLNKDDSVIVPEPMYIGYRSIFDTIGAHIIGVPSDQKKGFCLDVDQIKHSVTTNTRVMFLNTPGNPAGNIISADVLRELAAWCLERNIWLVCDEVYSMITFEQRHISLRAAAASLENVIIVDGLSKSHAMTGWRLGWTVAVSPITNRLLSFSTATVFGCSQFIQDAACYALKNDKQYMQEIRHEYQRRRDYVCSRLMAMPSLHCRPPAAGMFIMLDVSEVAHDGKDFAEKLLDRTGVSVLPGEAFGKNSKQLVRLSLTLPLERLKIAMDRIEGFYSSLTPV